MSLEGEVKRIDAMDRLLSSARDHRRTDIPRGETHQPRQEMLAASVPVTIITRNHQVFHGAFNPMALETMDEIELVSGRGIFASTPEDQIPKKP